MKQVIYILAILALSHIAGFGQNPEQTNQIIIKLKDDVGSKSKTSRKVTITSKVDAVTQKFQPLKIKSQSGGRHNKQRIYIIRFQQGTDLRPIIDAYYKTGEIEYAEPDHKGAGGGEESQVPDDQYYSRQWGLKNDGTFSLSSSVAGADIDMENAWSIETGDPDITVAIIDSGLKLDHPEFSGRLWTNAGEIPNNGADDDMNGYIDDMNGWDFANNDNDPVDDQGHGTNVTGIIGANGNNSVGYTGVDRNCKLMVLKGLDNANSGFYSWWANAIYYAVDNGAKAINMSVGGLSASVTLQNAIAYAIGNNVVVVASMANTNSNTVYYPAAHSGVIAVGSTNPDDTRTNPFFWSTTSGSNYGSHISVTAPGNYIYGLSYQSNTNYNTYWGGTSQAAPLVTGLASLLLAQNPNRTPAQIKSLIEKSSEDQVGSPGEDTPGWDQYYGHGRINAFRALSKAGQVITFNTLPDKRYGDNNFQLSAMANSGLIVSYSSSNTNVATISGSVVTIKASGTTTITASQGGDANYLAASNVEQSLTVKQKTISVSANLNQGKTQGASDPVLSYTVTPVLQNGDSFTGTLERAPGESIGNYPIMQGTLSAGSNYQIAFTGTNFNITPVKLNQTITFVLPFTEKFDSSPDFPLSAATTSNLPVTFTVTSGPASIVNENIVQLTPGQSGSVTITATQAGNASYHAAAPVAQIFTVKKDPTTSLETASISGQLNVFPNPVHSVLTIDAENQKIECIRFLDLSGRILRTEYLKKVSYHEVNVSAMPEGILLLQVQAPEGVTMKKIMIKK